MKFFGAIVLLLAVASSQATSHGVRNKRSAIDDGLAAIVEQIRGLMITGDETLGVPVMDPLYSDHLDFAIDQDIATLAGTLTNLTVTGLSDFTADALTFSVLGIKFTYSWNWPTINVATGYSLDGTIAGLLPIYGKGNLIAKLTNLNVSGTLSLSSSGGYLYIRQSTVSFALDSLNLQITGLLNDDETSAVIGAIVSDLGPTLVTEFQDQISTAVNNLIVSVGDQALSGMTLAELIDLIRG